MEHEPGDVADVQNEHGVWNRAIRRITPHGYVWAYGVADTVAPDFAKVRPLVVIDPENREQVERLARVTHIALTGDVPAWSTLSGKDQVRRMDALTMALDAELAPPQPPKPEEPTGLGAVVEDAHGRLYVYAPDGPTDYTPWTSPDRGFHSWDDVAAVRVVSPGVET